MPEGVSVPEALITNDRSVPEEVIPGLRQPRKRPVQPDA